MEDHSWERVLLQWVHTFEFTKTNYITLEQTDIDAFFAYYVDNVETVPVVEVALQAQPTQHLSPDNSSSGQLTPLQSFLAEMYPEFNCQTYGQGRLAESDYLYVYSLLLHYKCVKEPTTYYHNICKKLPFQTQSTIWEFFQQTLNTPLTRENLRQAINNVAAFQSTGSAEIGPFRAASVDSDGSGQASSLGDDPSDPAIDFIGPISSPSPKTRPPPATPKTELLEQRTREVRGLQAQLEAERYEKNFLEEQIMENEHLIKSLRKENKVKKQQLAKLKDSDENEEEDYIRKYIPNEFDHLKCSLLKEISQKEAIITETRDKLQDLRMENSELQSKVKSSSVQLVVCMDRIRDLEVRQEELTQAVSTKGNQVTSLERDKQELEQCLQVTRDELHNRREVLNASSDLLDLPMSPNTTPENLADSVIDKQLREKEHENLGLKEELQKLSKSMLAILADHGLAATSTVPEEQSSQLWFTVGVVREELTKSVRLNEELNSQLLEKRQQLEKALAQFAKLVEEGRQHAKELCDIRTQNEQELASLLSNQQDLQAENDRLLQSLNEANEKSAKADEHLQEIKAKLAEKEEQMSQQVHEHGKALADIQAKNEQKLAGLLSNQQSENDSLLQSLNLANEESAKADEHMQEIKAKLAEKEEQMSQQVHEHAKALADIQAQNEQKVSILLSSQQDLQSENDRLLQSLNQANEKSVKADEALQEIKVQLAEKEEQMSQQVHEHAKALADIQAQNEQKLAGLLSNQQSENDRLLQSLNLANEESAKADKHLQQIKLQLAEKEEQLSQLGREIAQLSDKNKTLENRANSLITERNSGVLQLQQEQRLQQYVRNKYAQCRSQLVAQSSDMGQLASHLKATDWVETLHRIDEVIADRAELQQQHEALKLEHAKFEKDSRELRERLQLAVNLHQSMQQNHEQQQTDLRTQLLTADERMESMRQRNLQFVEQIQTKVDQQLHTSQQDLESFLCRITALLNGTEVSVKSEYSLDNSRFEKFESLLTLALQRQSLEVKTLQATADQWREQLECAQRQHASELKAESQQRASRIDQLMRIVQTLEVRYAKVRSTLSQKDAEIAIGNEQVAKLQEQLASDQASGLLIKQLNDTIHNLEQVNEKLIDDNSKLQSLHMDISVSLSTVNTKVERLTTELFQCQACLAETIASDKLKANQLSESKAEQEKLQAQLKEISAKKAELEQHVEHLKTLKSECDERCQALEKQLAEQVSQGAQHKEQLEVIREKLKDALYNVEQQRQAILTDREEINKYRAQLADLFKARDQGKEEMAELRLMLSQGERDKQEHLNTIKDLCGQEQQLKVHMDKLKGEYSEELRRLQSLFMDKQAMTAQLKTQLASATELAQERARELAQAKLAQVELASSLQNEKEQLRAEADEKSSAANGRIVKLEKLRDSQDHKARQLSNQLAEAEKLVVRLNLEIGGLNSEIEQRKRQVIELEGRLKAEAENRNQTKEELKQITAKLAEVQQELNSARLVQDTQHVELDEKTREIELERAESAERIQRYKRRIESLEGELAEAQAAVSQAQVQVQAPTDLCATYSKEERTVNASEDELVQLRQEMARSKLDCQILQAKYRETKEEIQRCEQKMKDQRLEMEGKLDKMKTKMRSLYTAEVTRMKEKQERDAVKNKTELDTLVAQNAKYEEHTRKLSNQVIRLNDKILEQQKQHAIISTKLRHLQEQPLNVPKASATATPLVAVAAPAATSDDWQPFKRPSAPSSNLAMEDEEGEVFNNTYLTDLKLGRASDITAEELNYRNSLQPPHLKSTYAAQYDVSMQDEDLKDGPQSLDDSMCALLNSTGTGTRKKSLGTHYKRPGPPTPSKNGGRLSFGSSEPPREVLRECSDPNSKTPARFKFLTKRFSVGSSGLPRDELPERKRSSILTKLQRRRLQRQVAGAFCTSTPRKNRSYYDQQRLICASDEEFSNDEEIETGEQQTTPHLSNGALLALTQGNTRRITATPTPKRKVRVPLYLNGSVLAKSRSEGLKDGIPGERMRQRRKICRERMARFDQARPLDQVRLSDRFSCPNNSEQLLMGNTVVLDDGRGRRLVLGLTFKVEEDSLQQQQFETDNMTKWALDNENNEVEDCRFEQLCKQKASTAPFHVQPAGMTDSLSVRCRILLRTIGFDVWHRVAVVMLGLSVVVALLLLLNSPPKRRLSTMFKRKER